MLCQVVVEGEAAPPLDWTFIPPSGYRILWWQPQPYLRIDGWGGETVTPRSPAIWRWRRIDQGEVVCHLPEVERNL